MHNINEDRIFYAGEVPWHGIGTKLNNPATAYEAIQAAKLNYVVSKRGLALQEEIFNPRVIVPKHFATFREDTLKVLGVVSHAYKIIQNVEAFNFFDTIIGEGQAVYHTAGALGLGERIWILAKLPGKIVIKDNDIVDKYLLLMNSHDGTSALRMFFTPIRVVCQNTLTMALQDSNAGIAIRHTGDIKSKVAAAQQALGLANKAYADFEKDAMRLADRKLTQTEADMYFALIAFQGKKAELSVTSKLMETRYEHLLRLYRLAPGNDIPEVKETAWAAFNSVSYYTDHFKYLERATVIPERRLKNIWFGSGLEMKQRALKVALEI